ncbi:MAG: hypothetical protein C4530_14920 [Desulfobacteraceae bacterium]|nr:MAG: hypothetical protein C4530_14920 [Desulfobacteraceae bacterium]
MAFDSDRFDPLKDVKSCSRQPIDPVAPLLHNPYCIVSQRKNRTALHDRFSGLLSDRIARRLKIRIE